MSLKWGAVAELLLTDVAHKSLDASMLHQMSLQVVCRGKPTPTVLTMIGVVSFMNGYMQLESKVGGEMFATLVTATFQTSCIICHGSWQSVDSRSPMRQHCLENKHVLVRCSCLVKKMMIVT